MTNNPDHEFMEDALVNGCDQSSRNGCGNNSILYSTEVMAISNDQHSRVTEPNHSSAVTASFCDAATSNNGEHRNILRGLLSQQPMPSEPCGYFVEPPLERRFAKIVPFLETRLSDDAGFAHRPRCQSVDANLLSLKLVSARTPSRDSLVDSACDANGEPRERIGFPPTSSDNQIEAARAKLMTLTTHNNELDMDLAYGSGGRNSSSQPGSPPHLELLGPDRMYEHRKLSLGSQLKARLQALRMGFRTPVSHEQQIAINRLVPVNHEQQLTQTKYTNSMQPVDLSTLNGRRRRKFDGVVGLPYGRNTSAIGLNRSVDEGICDDSCSDASSSILKSILTGRERSNTISVCGLRSGTDPVTDFDSRKFYRQPVTLAKKNLHPVLAKISECLARISTFTRSLSDFTDRPSSDQRTLMAAALPRLLLLCMAESNIHFVVAPVLQLNKMEEFVEENREVISESGCSALSGGGFVRRGNVVESFERGSSEIPTLQFAECVKSFISKCQSLAISEQEYHLMRVIALFQSAGAVASETAEIADRANATARRDLQRLIEQTHSDDPILRYSALLMTFHTLFSINSAMLESLFCHPLATRLANGAELFFRIEERSDASDPIIECSPCRSVIRCASVLRRDVHCDLLSVVKDVTDDKTVIITFGVSTGCNTLSE